MILQVKRIRNRKNVNVNLRNKLVNKYYKSTIKTLTKKGKNLLIEYKSQASQILLLEIQQVSRLLISKIDKAVKKGILQINAASRYKSTYVAILKDNKIIL
jgi:small subunit ribosomal protein S20